MRPGEHQEGSPGTAHRGDSPRQLAEVGGCQSFGESGDKFAHRRARAKFPRELATFDFAR
jgi:hypothetical protein